MKNLMKELNHYILFNVVGMIGMSCYILADTFFIAQALKADGLAALNFSIAFFSFMQGIGLMIGIGGATDFSLRKENKNQSFMHTLLLGAVAAIFFILIGLLYAEPLASFLGADKQTLVLTSTYLKTFLSFSPFFILNNILLGFVRNDHNPKLVMAAMLISSFSNIVLDYIFIFPLNWGIFGAALATGLSPIISCLVCSLHFIQKRNTFHLQKVVISSNCLTNILRLGFSSFIGELASAIALFTFNWIIIGISGNTGVAAYGIIANIALIATAIFTGIAQGIQPIASRCVTNFKIEEIEFVRKYAITASILVAAFIYLIIYFFDSKIVALFNSDCDITLANLAQEGILLYFIGYFFAGINIVSIAFLSATGSTRKAILMACCRSCLFLIPVVFIGANLWGMRGIWLSFSICECIVLFYSIFLEKIIRKM